jgi:Outer membrane protein and related peptidoglycan-associated (lipo)proteins
MSLFASVAFVGLMSGCATTAPPQLIEARNAYTVSNNGLAAKLTPTELHDAWIVLAKANKEFDEHGDTTECRDYAYIAQNKLQLADVKARTELDRQKIAEAVKAGVVVRDTQVKNTRAALSSTREQLKEERRDSNAKTAEIEKTAEQLEVEKQARITAEARLAGAMKDLAAIAAIKEEARGLVITLSGSILFASNKYALLETAKTKLDQVAEALKAQDSDKRMVVEGHTDSQGSDRINQPLSLNRAEAVRDYLVSRGVDSDKISAIGMGSSRPLLDNRNAENRANNRRVEIIIQPSNVSVR